jgi:hypothetical protein
MRQFRYQGRQDYESQGRPREVRRALTDARDTGDRDEREENDQPVPPQREPIAPRPRSQQVLEFIIRPHGRGA